MGENHKVQAVPETTSIFDQQLSRRSMVGLSLAVGAGAVGLATGSVDASAKMHEEGHTHTPKDMSMVDVATKCIATGEKCNAHGLDVLSTGDTSLADCNRAVSVMLAVCHAVARMAALESKRLPDIVKVALHTCDDCRIECEKHADNHPECKACGEACATMLKAMKDSPLANAAG